MIKNENYITIQGWMINELHLKGNDLMVYAIIYGFSQEENSWFTGSRQYLADWCNSTIRGIQKNLQSLIDKGLIIKEDMVINNVKFCKYKAVSEFYTGEKSSPGVVNNVPGGRELSSPNNIDNNIIKKEKEKKETEIDQLINKKINNEQLKETLYDYIKMRKTIKSPATTKALNMIINKLNKYTDDIEEQIAILNKSIINNWKDVYPLTPTEKAEFNKEHNKEHKKYKTYDYTKLSKEDYARLMKKQVTAEELEKEGKLIAEYV